MDSWCGAVPSPMHQRISIWREDGIVENIEADQSYYMEEVNHVDKRHFDKNLANIAPCEPTNFSMEPESDAYCSLFLHPIHGFQWDRKMVGI